MRVPGGVAVNWAIVDARTIAGQDPVSAIRSGDNLQMADVVRRATLCGLRLTVNTGDIR